MNIFSHIVSRIWTDLYPHVEAVIEQVEKHVLDVAETAREAAEDVVDAVTDSPIAHGMMEKILDSFAEQRKAEGADDLSGWRTSVVDLFKLVNIDSSLSNRRRLANEVGIVGYEPTGAMNVELSKRVLAKLRGA